ncbi:hypothetical protein AALP_AA6G082500 [Arabis alpina]|uniref:Uncharacterized protein n=1 Tax=Arabis alpina TaxID=50452 RepID=A0A087GMW0_ARAAL|nr:hypothetical protein AALP_AA6G082500 [Arabis alpina]
MEPPETLPESSSTTRKSLMKNTKWLLEKMAEYNGDNAKLVINEKKLSTTDLKPSQSRLSLPKVVRTDYLTEEELNILRSNAEDNKKSGVPVIFLDTNKNAHNLEFKKWINNFVLTTGNPENWIQLLKSIGGDSMGCFLTLEERRFAVLLGSLLSHHPKDEVLNAIRSLHQNGLLNPEAMDKADESTIINLICSAEIDTSNATDMKIVANTCLMNYNGHIPNTLDDLQLVIPWIDPKMAQQTLDIAWACRGGFDDDSEFPLEEEGYLAPEFETEGYYSNLGPDIPPRDA